MDTQIKGLSYVNNMPAILDEDEGVLLGPKIGSATSSRSVTIYKTRPMPRSAKFRANSRMKAANKISPHEISRYACDALEMIHALKEFRKMHNNPELVRGFVHNRHINDPRFEKMQKAFNSLAGRAGRVEYQEPRITRLFEAVIREGIHAPVDAALTRKTKDDIKNLIKRKNLVSAGSFKKFGIICIKDAAMPNPRPENAVTPTELREMEGLSGKLADTSASNSITIEGDEDFRQKTLDNFDKMLTFKEGRTLIKLLYTSGKPIRIISGAASSFEPKTNTVRLDHQDTWTLAKSRGRVVSILKPSWATLPHELIHAFHASNDFKERKAVDPKSIERSWGGTEEYVTIGNPDAIPTLSENGFLRHTLGPLRIYHEHGISPDLNLMKQIEIACIKKIDGDIERILEDPNLTKEQFEYIAKHTTTKNSPLLIGKIMNHPLSEGLITPAIIESYLRTSLIGGDEETIHSIFDKLPTIHKLLSAAHKKSLFFAAANYTPNLLPLLASFNYHEEFTPELYFRYFSNAIRVKDKKSIQTLIGMKKILKFDPELFQPLRAQIAELADPEIVLMMLPVLG